MENNNDKPIEQVVEEKQPEGDSISSHVKQDVVAQLVEMGFSKNVAEKACFFNQSILEKSIEWIYEHQQDPDFEEELRIVGQENKEQLSEEEIKRRAKELQEYARKRYQEKQKELEEEQERNRIRQSKTILTLS
jgi:uncharacterized UBP type Zn finger protein